MRCVCVYEDIIIQRVRTRTSVSVRAYVRRCEVLEEVAHKCRDECPSGLQAGNSTGSRIGRIFLFFIGVRCIVLLLGLYCLVQRHLFMVRSTGKCIA